MSLLEIVLVACGLAMDACAVSIAAGAAGQAQTARSIFRLSFHFGLFQFLMPVAGWFVGTQVSHLIAAFDHWLAFGLLVLVGGRMIRASFAGPEAPARGDPSRGLTLIALSVATSIDALAVGLSLAFLEVAIWYPSVVIGVVTAALSLVGIALGRTLGRRLGVGMELFGGLLLILIGVKILIEHLVA